MGPYLSVRAHTSCCFSPAAGILGDVIVGEGTSVFAGAQIRGDLAPIVIGRECNIQENVTIHVNEHAPCLIGDGVTIGHNAVVHACSLEDGVMVGMGSVVMDGVSIGEESIVAAGAVVPQGKSYPPRSLIMGVPAKAVRQLTEEDLEKNNRKARKEYVELSQEMAEEGVMFHPGRGYCGQIGLR